MMLFGNEPKGNLALELSLEFAEYARVDKLAIVVIMSLSA